MRIRLLFSVLLILGFGSLCLGQDRARQSIRRRRPIERLRPTEAEEPEEPEPVSVTRVRGRSRARSQPVTQTTDYEDDYQLPVSRPRSRSSGRPRTSNDARAVGRVRGGGKPRGRQRPRGRGMQRGRRPPVRRPNYDYYDYYYDEYYDQFYYDDEYYQEENLPPPRKKKKNGPFSNVQPVEEPVATSVKAFGSAAAGGGPDLAALSGGGGGSPDYGCIIKQLWEEYLKEKQGGGARTREPEEEYECPPREDSYYEPDEEQCDKYFECNIKGEIKEHLCPDGFVFDITLEKCDYPVKVNCSTRPVLQEPQPSTNCSRANGFFPWPANISCQNFWDCREGTAYKQTCPVGVIFDPGLNTCATPDQSTRQECKEGETSFLGFQCPKYTPESVLRFGNHDRLPHPTDCQQYFSCLKSGEPRLATCPRKQVFNNVTGHCGDPNSVPGCENYWEEKLKDKEGDYYYDDYY